MEPVTVLNFILVFVSLTYVLSQVIPCDNTAGETCLLAKGFDDYQLAKCSSNEELEPRGFQCEDKCTNACWHLCMFEKFGEKNGSVSENCSCKPYFRELPSWCYEATGHCDFNQNCTFAKYGSICLPSHLGGTGMETPMFYNNLCPVINDFFRFLDCETKIWLDGFRKCLQQYLIDTVIKITTTCSDLKTKGEDALNICIQTSYSGKTFYDMEKSKPKHTTCTTKEIDDIITAPSGGITMLPSNACDEVYPGLFIGEESIGKSRVGLREMGITHVVNTAMGKGQYFVNTNHVMFQKVGIQFYGFEAMDMMHVQLTPFFQKSADFIDQGLKEGGKVMVHCKVGASRSATIVIAFLMMKRHMTVQEAVRMIRTKREIAPNEGFLQQLCDLNDKLHNSGHFNKESNEDQG
ncbi:uncharacterized protein LOC133191154 [Saccostrea echinata]|uniref:uncharacterized protein LOC133191154 n=1 Tax=Saccostrea echinata TaxID=191078 RepID=UPI002A83300E|nr:uncharacterized protein LOC133191154 [Saccostrea echinata]